MKLGLAFATLATLLALRNWIKSAYAVPGALVAMCLTGALILRSLGLTGVEHGWYLPSPGALKNWSPLAVAHSSRIDWPMLVARIPEMLAVGIVALISLVTKVSRWRVKRPGILTASCVRTARQVSLPRPLAASLAACKSPPADSWNRQAPRPG